MDEKKVGFFLFLLIYVLVLLIFSQQLKILLCKIDLLFNVRMFFWHLGDGMKSKTNEKKNIKPWHH